MTKPIYIYIYTTLTVLQSFFGLIGFVSVCFIKMAQSAYVLEEMCLIEIELIDWALRVSTYNNVVETSSTT